MANLTSVGGVERKIRRTEGFRVRILRPPDTSRRRDVRSDKQKMPPYHYTNAADGEWTVRKWKESRFHPTYPGFDVDVLERSGSVAGGLTRLVTVRATYEGGRG